MSILRVDCIVIPAQAGIQVFTCYWTPAFAGVTGRRGTLRPVK